ncbi:hypothetical protein A9995_12880 [Erythrobacter sp. QSSC1-22B]|uniref:hypothetical protein n=1 Tax=Erythrobacter sp. QSSC1-22B TaxID=1860125 RepID=UPI000805BEA8|nr:hypothetical protein [Erythrobacter sp. QSSC1-22B]OBX18361.1 hypothetical protein A9995_12880 [Erythrobacter sp. QSSC1-22B]
MSTARLRMIEDRHLRNSAKALVEADIAHLKADLAERSIGARAADRIADGASEVYDEAVEVATDNKGALAAIVAALVLWFARNPIIDALFGEDPDDRDDARGDRDDRDRYGERHDEPEQESRWRR